MFWKPKRLTCHIYENKVPLSLSQCSYTELIALVNSIQEIWKAKQQEDQSIWYTVDLEERRHFFRKQGPTIKVSCFALHPQSWSGKKRISIAKVKHGRPLGKPIQISPRNTLTHSWSGNIEVIFLED